MCKKYLGHLPEHDPLYNYLKYEIQPQISGYSGHLTYRVFELNASNDVYLYEEASSPEFVSELRFWEFAKLVI